jgi:hypothetical protein
MTEHLDVVGPVAESVQSAMGVKLPAASVVQVTMPSEGIPPEEVSVTVAVQVVGTPTAIGDPQVVTKLVEWPVVMF